MSPLARHWSILCLALAACGDTAQVDPDASVPPPDAAPDAPPGSSFTPPTPVAVPLSAAGPDQLLSVTAAPGGKFYAAGFAAQTLTGPRFITIVKYSAAGLDSGFGDGGKVTTAVDFKGGAGELDITTQPDGKILVSATVADPDSAGDRDIAVIRLLDSGALDMDFGDGGIAMISPNDAHDSGTGLVSPDSSRGITASATAIYVHGASRGLGDAAAGGPRTDTDFVVARLTPEGDLDTGFATQGFFRLDLEESPANPRAIRVLPDGAVLASGYANSPGLASIQPVLLKLTAEGARDPGFGQNGVFHQIVLAVQSEIYSFAIHGSNIVTTGYGRNAGAINDYLSMRFDLETGTRDLTWGGASDGAVTFDPSGTRLGSNCRNGIALPAGKTLMVGSTGPANMPTQDAVFAVLDATGRLDTAYGAGVFKLPLGTNGNDQFWGAAISGDQVTMVGFRGGGPTASQTETSNDDAYHATFTLR